MSFFISSFKNQKKSKRLRGNGRSSPTSPTRLLIYYSLIHFILHHHRRRNIGEIFLVLRNNCAYKNHHRLVVTTVASTPSKIHVSCCFGVLVSGCDLNVFFSPCPYRTCWRFPFVHENYNNIPTKKRKRNNIYRRIIVVHNQLYYTATIS